MYEVKGKGNPYSILVLGQKLIPVDSSQHADDIVINMVEGCYYFSPGPQLVPLL